VSHRSIRYQVPIINNCYVIDALLIGQTSVALPCSDHLEELGPAEVTPTLSLQQG